MGEYEERKMICPECGNCPVDVGGDVSAPANQYTRRIRRRVSLVWLGLVVVLGVLALPWVQVAIGHWGFRHRLYVGNMNAVWNGGTDFITDEIRYQPLVEPPVRWRDLESAAQGEAGAVGQFRRAVEGVLDRPTIAIEAYSEYSFQIGTPKFFYNPVNGQYVNSTEGADEYSLRSTEYELIGWPIPWVSYSSVHFSGPNTERFARDGMLSFEEDMVHTASPMVGRLRRMNALFLAILVGVCGVAVRRVCLWRGVEHRRSLVGGLIVAGVVGGVVLGVGSQWRSSSVSMAFGDMTPILTGRVRGWGWDRDGIEARLSSDTQLRDFARVLIDEFGEMTQPNALVAIGTFNPAGSVDSLLEFGMGRFRLFEVGHTTNAKLEADGSYTRIPVPEDDAGLSFWSSNGIVAFNSTFGANQMVSYGLLVEYRNMFLVGVGLYVLLGVLRWIGFWWSRRVQRRRLGRGVCVWCRYPCGG